MLHFLQVILHHVKPVDASLEILRQHSEQRGDLGIFEVLELRDDVIALFAGLHPIDKILQALTAQPKTVDALGKHSGKEQSIVANVLADLAFAVDSIPAIFAITRDPFIVYTSNICAILGLRSLYFLLAGLMNRFIYLRTGLALVLGFVGIKMIIADYVPLPRVLSLGIIALILGITIALSMVKTQNRVAAEGKK